MAPRNLAYSEFQKTVYKLITDVPEGRITTLEALARYLRTSEYQIEKAITNLPTADPVPVHRVLRAVPRDDDEVALTVLKPSHRKLLSAEGVDIPPNKALVVGDWWVFDEWAGAGMKGLLETERKMQEGMGKLEYFKEPKKKEALYPWAQKKKTTG